ncbi:MAG TPA: GTP cyclohydrolase I, partial [Thermomicrobiales bacterium]|nr:GTP cyclohydrolase I [Thermomicrobiales bacterium]
MSDDDAIATADETGDAPSIGPRPGVVTPAPFDLPRIERAVREILLAIGEDPDREGLRRTPARVAESYAELFAGLREDPRRHLGV